MNIKSIIASFIVLGLVVGCTTAQIATAKTIVDDAGKVCEVVFVAADPTLAPLCTTAADLVEAELLVQNSIVDGGLGLAPAPTNAQIYAYLKAHGATTVKQ